MATINFGRVNNSWRVAEMNVFNDGDIEIRYNLANIFDGAVSPQVAFNLDGQLDVGVEARIGLEINYDDLTLRLFKY